MKVEIELSSLQNLAMLSSELIFAIGNAGWDFSRINAYTDAGGHQILTVDGLSMKDIEDVLNKTRYRKSGDSNEWGWHIHVDGLMINLIIAPSERVKNGFEITWKIGTHIGSIETTTHTGSIEATARRMLRR